MGNLTKLQSESIIMPYCIIIVKIGCLHVFNLRTLLSRFQSEIREGLLHFEQTIPIIIIFTYITYIIYSIYTYICLKCRQFLKINAGNSLSESPAVLRGSAARHASISLPMCDQGTTCNWHIRSQVDHL